MATSNSEKLRRKKPAASELKIVSSLPKAELKPKKQTVGDQVILDYLNRASAGEKKTEAGIKYWFEQNIPGTIPEDSSGVGAPDAYTPGWLVLELKGKQADWLEGLFQGLARKDLSYKMVVVAAHNILAVFPSGHGTPSSWDDSKRERWLEFVRQAHELSVAPNKAGKSLALSHKKLSAKILNEFSIFKFGAGDENQQGMFQSQSSKEAMRSFRLLTTSFDPTKARLEITPKNFASILESLLPFFEDDLDCRFEVVHGFFRCISYWNLATEPIIPDDPAQQDRVVLGAGHFEKLKPECRDDFAHAIRRYEVLRPDKSRFYAHYDKAIDVVDPEYRANHGIYFTNEYLARLAITLSEEYIGSLAEKYVVFDPACGSGNLVASWNHHLDLRHKVVSEISPVLLKAFELRFQGKSTERKRGFTIIPKTSTGEGLNFVSQSAEQYLERINKELKDGGHKLNKPLAIVCNPPYRNQKSIKNDVYSYGVDESLINIAGKDASRELFVAFLAQISEICRLAEENKFPPNSIVLLFTKSVWLTGKSSFKKIASHFLKNFKERLGFVVNSTEFFDVKQSWPLLVSLWEYCPDSNLKPARPIVFDNYLGLKRSDLKKLANDTSHDFDDLSNWRNDEVFRASLKKLLKQSSAPSIKFNSPIKKLKDFIPPQAADGSRQIGLEEVAEKAFMGGMCFSTAEQIAEREEKFLKRVYPLYEESLEKKKKPKIPSFVVNGHVDGDCIGFTESKQPFRTNRNFTNDGKSLFFMMDTRFMKMKTSQCFSGITTKRGHLVSDLNEKSKNIIIGYAMAQSLYGNYPIQFDQFDMWLPEGTALQRQKLFEMAAAFLYASNGCIECEVPANHPVKGTARVFVTNPLSTARGTFWETQLKPVVSKSSDPLVAEILAATNKLFTAWKKWISDNPGYRAKASLPIYSHLQNRQPLDGWGIFQIELEIKAHNPLLESPVGKANIDRRLKVEALKKSIRDTLEKDFDYWSQA